MIWTSSTSHNIKGYETTSLHPFSTLAMEANAQSAEQPAIERACLNYIEGFYEADTTKLIKCLSPSLHKYG